MFDTDALVGACREALTESDPRRAVREVLVRTLEDPTSVAEAIGKQAAGLNLLYNAPDLTILNVVWAPEMAIFPHDHRMWAVIGIYGGAEDNTLYKRTQAGIKASGHRELRDGDVFALGPDAIHAVRNPMRRFTGAIHVYGGDFVNEPRSQWDPDTLLEQPYDAAEVLRLFAEANAAWTEQLGHDIDDAAD